MTLKILIATPSNKEKEDLEKIFLEVVEKGGEILFATNEKDTHDLLKKENPKLAFIDSSFLEPAIEGVHIVWLCEKDETKKLGQDVLFRPFTLFEVIEKSMPVVSLSSWEAAKPFLL